MQENWFSFWQNRKRRCQWQIGKNQLWHGNDAGTPKSKGLTEHVNIELGALRVERHEKDKTYDPNKSRQLDTKYVTFRLTNQQYCNRKEIYRGDEKKYIKSHGKRIVCNEWIYWEIYFTGRHNHRKFFLRSNKKAGCKSV